MLNRGVPDVPEGRNAMTRILLGWTALFVLAAAPVRAQETVRLTQEAAVARALDTSHRLAEANARVTGAEAAIRSRQAAEQPTVNVSGGYTRTNHVDQFFVPQPIGPPRVIYPDIPDNYFSRVAFQWPIYTAGKTDALIRAAEAEARAATEDVRTARADLKLETIRAYWALVTATEAERVLQEAVTRADATVRDVRARYDSGLIPPNEVSSAEAQRSRQQLQLIESQNQRRSVLEDLRRLTGITGGIEPADVLTPPTATPPTPPPTIVNPSTAALQDARPVTEQPTAPAGDRSERQALVERIAAAEERQRAIEAGRKPTVAVTAGADYSNPNPRIFPRTDAWRHSWDLSVTANWNLWDGGRIAAEAAEAAAVTAATRERLAELNSQIAVDIAQRRLDLDSASASLGAADDGVRSATEARRVVSERFSVGVATSTDVLDAQVALLQAELDRTRALASIKLAEARLDRALGR
jgi:outer membrane protein TolC